MSASGMDLGRMMRSAEPQTVQVVGTPMPVRTINKDDITSVRLRALDMAMRRMPILGSLSEAMAVADEIVVWALRPATEDEERANSGQG